MLTRPYPNYLKLHDFFEPNICCLYLFLFNALGLLPTRNTWESFRDYYSKIQQNTSNILMMLVIWNLYQCPQCNDKFSSLGYIQWSLITSCKVHCMKKDYLPLHPPILICLPDIHANQIYPYGYWCCLRKLVCSQVQLIGNTFKMNSFNAEGANSLEASEANFHVCFTSCLLCCHHQTIHIFYLRQIVIREII